MAERLETIEEIVEKYAVITDPVKRRIHVSLASVFVVFAIVGRWGLGWPTVSWAFLAAFLFSLSHEKMFRWILTYNLFGPSIFEYYATGKTLPRHVKIVIASMIGVMTTLSAYFVWYVSTKGDDTLFDMSSWNGADIYPFGSIAIIAVGLMSIAYVLKMVKTRDPVNA